MQPEGITIALRQRQAWEATDLGVALVREHARPIFAAWFIVSLPVWVLLNALGVAIEAPWVALLAMWWLKPLFDRVPLFAISRAVFGHAPSPREIVRAQFRWGWREIAPWLLWRRLHLGRLLLLPVDLLEHATGALRRERARVLTKGDAGPRNQLALLGTEFELALSIAAVLLGLMFVPSDFLPDATAQMFRRLFDHPPLWAQVALNGCVWIGTSLVEPFLVGAGFGLYLNRRVQLEAWDIEHAFRRLAQRLSRLAQPACLLLVLAAAWSSVPAVAAGGSPCAPAATSEQQDAVPATELAPPDCGAGRDRPATSLGALFGRGYRSDSAGFARRVKAAHAGLYRTVRESDWQSVDDKPDRETIGQAGPVARFVALIARWWLWIIVLVVLVLLAINHRRWMSWIRDPEATDAPSAIESRAAPATQALPDDIPAAVRALWQRGEQRAALALLYQAAVRRLSEQLRTPLPPGATEGECLSRCRRLDDRRFAGLFTRIVACWQAAAYARRMPELGLLDSLLDEWAQAPAVAA